jgi:hypothetical protein
MRALLSNAVRAEGRIVGTLKTKAVMLIALCKYLLLHSELWVRMTGVIMEMSLVAMMKEKSLDIYQWNILGVNEEGIILGRVFWRQKKGDQGKLELPLLAPVLFPQPRLVILKHSRYRQHRLKLSLTHQISVRTSSQGAVQLVPFVLSKLPHRSLGLQTFATIFSVWPVSRNGQSMSVLAQLIDRRSRSFLCDTIRMEKLSRRSLWKQ